MRLVFFIILKRSTARLVGPETVIHSPNCFALPCAGPFHKIHTGYEDITTVNSSCLMYGYYFDTILRTKVYIRVENALENQV